MFLIIKTDSETSELGRISGLFPNRPTFDDLQVWDGPTLENDENCTSVTWTIIDCNTGKEEGSITLFEDGEESSWGCLSRWRPDVVAEIEDED